MRIKGSVKMVSFGSNYKFNVGYNFPYEVMDKLACQHRKGVVISEEFTPFSESVKTGVFAKVSVSSPDSLDDKIEALLLSKGIDFHKQTFAEALDLENIKNRIQLSKNDKEFGYNLVEFDTDVLDELFKEDGVSYIEPHGKNGLGTRYRGVGEYLKTGRNIDATRVHFRETDGSLSALIEDGRHRFAYMRDLGMKTIPVSIDENSYEIAQKYGLI